MKRLNNIMLFTLVFVFSVIILLGTLYRINMLPVGNSKKEIKIFISDTSINTVTEQLYEKNLIKNKKVFKIYLGIFSIKKFNKGTYILNKSMSSEEIVHILTRE